jgi:hypothetical protein
MSENVHEMNKQFYFRFLFGVAIYVCMTLIGYQIAINYSFPPTTNSPFWLRIIVGPCIGLTRTHGAEFYLFATAICIPCIGVICWTRKIWLKLIALIFIFGIWGRLGLFMTN